MAILPSISVSLDLDPQRHTAVLLRTPTISTPFGLHRISVKPQKIFGFKMDSREIEQTRMRLSTNFNSSTLTTKASREPSGLTQELDSKLQAVPESESGCDLFKDMKHRFLSFKKNKYMEHIEHYEKLAQSQAPKFMVIACADSRVCPSAILGFQPGEAFTVRNVANLVPPFESGPSETNAALEFAVNSLEESINRSLLNLLTYPWIEERVRKGILSIHGGYYDFVDCTFEKWTLDYEESNLKEANGGISVKDQLFWC